jgi:hypothetical protein
MMMERLAAAGVQVQVVSGGGEGEATTTVTAWTKNKRAGRDDCRRQEKEKGSDDNPLLEAALSHHCSNVDELVHMVLEKLDTLVLLLACSSSSVSVSWFVWVYGTTSSSSSLYLYCGFGFD